MKIKVKSLQGDEYTVDVQEDNLVSSLKAAISDQIGGLPAKNQKLVYKGRTMQDSSPIRMYALDEGCKVHLMIQKDSVPSCHEQRAAIKKEDARQSSQLPISNSDAHINSRDISTGSSNNFETAPSSRPTLELGAKQIKFEMLLREKLASELSSNVVDRIVANLHKEIHNDINFSSLDDIERFAKLKLPTITK